MNGLNFITLSVECWDNIRRARKQLLFEALLRKIGVHVIFYFNPPLYKSKTLCEAIPELEGMHVCDRNLKFRGERFSVIKAINGWINYFEIRSMLPPGRKWASFFYNPKDIYIARHLKKIGKIFFDWTEDWAVYHEDPSLNTYQRLALKESDGVVVATRGLEKLASEAGLQRGKILYLPNATSWDPNKLLVFPDILKKIPEPRIGYLGHLGPWFDKELVLEIVKAQPSWNWVMVGHASNDIKDYFWGYPNIHLLGQLQFNSLQDHMSFCQILTAPYKKNISGDATKLYDYLATDLPIVSADIETALLLKPFIKTATTVESWIHTIQTGLHLNKIENRESRRAACRNHTWDARATTLLDWMEKL